MNSKEQWKCPYCRAVYDSYDKADTCLDNHRANWEPQDMGFVCGECGTTDYRTQEEADRCCSEEEDSDGA